MSLMLTVRCRKGFHYGLRPISNTNRPQLVTTNRSLINLLVLLSFSSTKSINLIVRELRTGVVNLEEPEENSILDDGISAPFESDCVGIHFD